MAAAPTPLRELVVQALERLDNHIVEDNRRFEEAHRWREDFERRQDQRHRESRAALEEAAQKRGEIYRKIDDLADAIGEVERAAHASSSAKLWAFAAAAGTLFLAALGAAAYLADKLYSKAP